MINWFYFAIFGKNALIIKDYFLHWYQKFLISIDMYKFWLLVAPTQWHWFSFILFVEWRTYYFKLENLAGWAGRRPLWPYNCRRYLGLITSMEWLANACSPRAMMEMPKTFGGKDQFGTIWYYLKMIIQWTLASTQTLKSFGASYSYIQFESKTYQIYGNKMLSCFLGS